MYEQLVGLYARRNSFISYGKFRIVNNAIAREWRVKRPKSRQALWDAECIQAFFWAQPASKFALAYRRRRGTNVIE